jgi:ABC-2 type transport system ATP-binding protein
MAVRQNSLIGLENRYNLEPFSLDHRYDMCVKVCVGLAYLLVKRVILAVMKDGLRPVAIEARGLVKVFQTARRATGLLGTLRSLVAPEMVTKAAVTDVSFSVAQGELLALLGPNGAGKSTTIKMLTGIITPTAGEAIVAGVVPYRERERNARNIGAVFGQRTQLWWDLPARESFRILRDIYGVGRTEHEARLREFDSLLELSSFWDTRVRHLSLGQRVRCDLAAALLHDPQVVFLDEPTIGMDVVVKEQVRALLRHQVEQRGRAVLLTTHDMTEVERLAERVVLINHGRIMMDGTLTEIRGRFGKGWRVHATIRGQRDTVAEPWPPGLVVTGRDRTALVFSPAPLGRRADSPGDGGMNGGPAAVTLHQALKLIIERYEVTDIRVEESDLEEVMRTAYAREHEPQRLGGELAT